MNIINRLNSMNILRWWNSKLYLHDKLFNPMEDDPSYHVEVGGHFMYYLRAMSTRYPGGYINLFFSKMPDAGDVFRAINMVYGPYVEPYDEAKEAVQHYRNMINALGLPYKPVEPESTSYVRGEGDDVILISRVFKVDNHD